MNVEIFYLKKWFIFIYFQITFLNFESMNHFCLLRFEAWKACLGVLGIPFLEVMRVLAAVLLLGNVTFIEGQGLEVDIQGGSHELKVMCRLEILVP